MADPQKKQPSYEELRAEVERLSKALTTSETEKTEAQKRAAIFTSNEQEVPTGNSVEISRCKGYETVGFHDDGRPILKAQWEKATVPTFWYTIDMPPVGGTDIKLNGKEFYHGKTYEVTPGELRTLKEMCARLWAHEREIHHDNEKEFRGHYTNKVREFFPRGAVTASGKKVLN